MDDNEDLISVIDAASETGIRKQTLFKLIKRLGLPTVKQRNPNHRNQMVSYITRSNLALILREASVGSRRSDSTETPPAFDAERGIFYLVQLEPKHDPGRFKVGFAANMAERLRSHRCSAPFAEVIQTWPCHNLWERTAIDCVTQDCEQIHTEVFRTDDISRVKERCNRFFSLMPLPDGMEGQPSNADIDAPP